MFLLSWISVLKLEATIEVKLLSLIHWFNKYVLKAYFVLDIMLYTFTSYTRLNTYQFLFFRKSWAMPCQWSRPLLPNKKKCNRKLNSFNRRSEENLEKLKPSECLTKKLTKGKPVSSGLYKGTRNTFPTLGVQLATGLHGPACDGGYAA